MTLGIENNSQDHSFNGWLRSNFRLQPQELSPEDYREYFQQWLNLKDEKKPQKPKGLKSNIRGDTFTKRDRTF